MKRRKYATGSTVQNYIESPDKAMKEHQIDIAGAKAEAASNPFANILNMVGGLAMKTGVDMAGGLSGVVGGIKEGAGIHFPKKALGGSVDKVPVEVEGGEVAETPFGELIEFAGPDHKNGGIKTDLPDQTEVYSKRISIDGKNMADRKTKRAKAESKIAKLFEASPGDKMLKKTLERVQANNQREDAADRQLQDMIALLENSPKEERQEFSKGGRAGRQFDRELARDARKFNPDGSEKPGLFDDILGSTTLGDLTGLYGTIAGAFGQKSLTEQQRAGDTANINAFEGYGIDALAALDKSKGYVKGLQSEALQDVESTRAADVARSRGGARGINQMRALDTQAGMKADKARGEVFADTTRQMMNLFQQQAGIEGEQDKIVMAGEQARDLADRQDRDAYYTALSQDQATKAEGIQQLGKNVNAMKESQYISNLLDQLSTHGLKLDKSGKIVGKKG